MRLERVKAAIVLAACALAAPAAAHVAPSPDVNNRYLKATLLPDRLRLQLTAPLTWAAPWRPRARAGSACR